MRTVVMVVLAMAFSAAVFANDHSAGWSTRFNLGTKCTYTFQFNRTGTVETGQQRQGGNHGRGRHVGLAKAD